MVDYDKIVISSDGGVFKYVIKKGLSDECPFAGCKVILNYIGKFCDGTIFDSSFDRGQPFEYLLGKGGVIKAFDMGVASMKRGEKCILTCSPLYAYGVHGSPPNIPPNATLLFELEMLGWKGEDLSPNMDSSIERYIIENSERKRTPSEGALVKVHIVGMLGGVIFEDRDIQFVYGEGCEQDVIKGVEIALGKMAIGETSKIKVKPKYAFGMEGNNLLNIPPNSDVEYIVKLNDCDKGIEEWKLTTDERIDLAKLYKEKGTTYFKKDNFTLALKMYQKCIEVLPDNGSKDAVHLKIAAYNNKILCYQKTNDFFKGKNSCNDALILDEDNIKALYRRGVCNLAINEYRAAAEDFERVIKLDPSNRAATKQINVCTHKIKECNQRERKIYANMFSKFAAVDKKHNQSISTGPSDVLSKCGEWIYEDTQCDAELEFERDNNIVMI